MFIDTHTHLYHTRFDKDRREVIMQMKNAGVEYFLENPIDYESNFIMREKLEDIDYVKFAAGIHPTKVYQAKDEWMNEIKKLVEKENTIAIGEAGLDYHIPESEYTWEVQKIWFRKFIELSKETDKPLVLHIREAFEDAIKILKENGSQYRGVVHCFNGNKEQAMEYLELGLYLGIGGAITRENLKLTDALHDIPMNRIVLETDSPFVTPKPFTGKNTPLYIPYIADVLAEIKGISKMDVEMITTENAKRLFTGLC